MNQSVTEPSTNGTTGYSPEVIAICSLLSIFFVVGTIGNALAFIIYYRKREKGTSTIFIISLTVTDFFTCLIAIPYSIIHELIVYKYSIDIFCRLYIFIQTFNIPLSSLILVAIGFDRYFCICHPFLHVITVPRAKKLIFLLTLVSVSLGIVPFLGHSIYYVETITQNVLVPIRSAESLLSNQTSQDLTALAPLAANLTLSAADSLIKATPLSQSTPSMNMFTGGLFLNPDSDFLNQMEHGENVPYRTSHASSLTTTPISTIMNGVSEAANALNYTVVKVNTSVVINYGRCVISTVTISENLLKAYQLAYASLFLVEFIVIAILYGLIYRSILLRRAWKARRRQRSNCNNHQHDEEETQLTNVNGTTTDVAVVKKNPGRISAAMRDRTLYANVRTAAMLFVVTVVFVVSFLPSWLIGLKILHFNFVVFYLFYFNNVANPIIYAFMNRTFRDELVLLIKNCVCRR